MLPGAEVAYGVPGYADGYGAKGAQGASVPGWNGAAAPPAPPARAETPPWRTAAASRLPPPPKGWQKGEEAKGGGHGGGGQGGHLFPAGFLFGKAGKGTLG